MSHETPTRKAAGGRPTLYRPEYCDTVVTLATEGMSLTEMAHELGVVRDTLYEWDRVHPEFSAALTRARVASQAWWERQGRLGLTQQGFNASLWSKNVSCRFRDDWTEKTQTELTGKNGEPLFRELYIVAVEPQST